MSKRSLSKELLISLGCLTVGAGVAIGGTLALFTSEKTVTNRLTVGTGLKAGLYLTSLENDILTEAGTIKSKRADLTTYKDQSGNSAYDTDKQGVDLSKYTGSIFTVEYLAPTMTGEANLRLYNLGDLAFTFDVTLTKKGFDADGKEDSSAVVLDQVKWEMEIKDDAKQVKASSYADIVLSYEFLDLDNNNDAAGQTVSLDLNIKATQVTKQ